MEVQKNVIKENIERKKERKRDHRIALAACTEEKRIEIAVHR